MPRPTALTDENEKLVLEAIRTTGASEAIAAGYAGVHPDTVAHWRRTGDAASEKIASERTEFEERCLVFSVRLRKAKSDVVLSFQQTIVQAIAAGTRRAPTPDEPNPPEPTHEQRVLAVKASTTLLGRLDPTPTTIHVGGEEGGAPINLEGSVTVETIVERLARIRAERESTPGRVEP